MFWIKIPLSVVIENTTQILFPTMQLVGRVEPVFCQRRENIKFHHRAQPVGGAGGRVGQTEVAVTNAEAGTKGGICSNFPVQCLDLFHQSIEGFVVERRLIFLESLGGERGSISKKLKRLRSA